MNDTQGQPAALYTVAAFAERHSGFLTVGALRQLLFHRTTNGLIQAGAIAKLGTRVLIDEAKFLGWMREQAQLEVVGSRRGTSKAGGRPKKPRDKAA